MLVMDDVIYEGEEIGDTNNVDSSDEIIDHTQATYDTFREKMCVLVKDDDGGMEATSDKNDNWILKTGLHGARIQLPRNDWVTPPPHNNNIFGLGINDQLLHAKRRADWCAPTEADILENTPHMNKLEEKFGLDY